MGNISMKLFKFGPVVQIKVLIDKKSLQTDTRQTQYEEQSQYLSQAS